MNRNDTMALGDVLADCFFDFAALIERRPAIGLALIMILMMLIFIIEAM